MHLSPLRQAQHLICSDKFIRPKTVTTSSKFPTPMGLAYDALKSSVRAHMPLCTHVFKRSSDRRQIHSYPRFHMRLSCFLEPPGAMRVSRFSSMCRSPASEPMRHSANLCCREPCCPSNGSFSDRAWCRSHRREATTICQALYVDRFRTPTMIEKRFPATISCPDL